MKRITAFLGNKWFLGILGLTSISLLIWFGAEFIKFGEDNVTLSSSVRATVIGIFWLIWLTWNISQWLLERKQNKELLDGIEESQEDTSDPDAERSQEELSAMNERFREALSTLKGMRFSSRFGKRSLYQLPWYIIIGPPGSGKTTALVNSGLEFPLAKSHGKQALGGIGGTRNCDWWFTNEAVLIDTAGRYTTQDSHRVVDNNAWKAFLTLLKKYRRRRPINGALVAISLQDLMVQTAEQRAQQAKTIRSRINELQEELGVRFPVYLTFTKCDLVAGFSEFFGNLSQAEREQVWGMSFPEEQDEATGVDLKLFKGELAQLIMRLNERLVWRVQNERNQDKRALIQGFPVLIESLNAVLDDFVSQTFSQSKYGQTPMLRGVYFTSATQEGSPIDRMMAQVSANFGLERSQVKQQHNSGKSFFITRLFNDVVFPESELVGVNRKVENILQWARRGAFATLSAVFVGSVALWLAGVSGNSAYMAEVKQQFGEYQLQKASYSAYPSIEETLNVVKPVYRASTVYDQEEHPLISNLGLYDGRVDQAADTLYISQLQEIFLPALIDMTEKHLQQMTAEDTALLPVFRVYLMIFDTSHRDYSEIRAYAKTRWADLLPGQAGMQQELLTHLDNLIAAEFNNTLEPDSYIVDRARHHLNSIPLAQRLFAELKKVGNNAVNVDLYREVGGDTETWFGLKPQDEVFRMPYLFTIDGFKNAEYGPRSDMMKRIAADRWIYGDQQKGKDFSDADLEKLSDEVGRLYLTEYARRWQHFSEQFVLQSVSSVGQATSRALTLADTLSSPLQAVVDVIVKHTRLTPDPEINKPGKTGELLNAVVSAVYEPTIVDNQFRDLHRLVRVEKAAPSKMQSYLEAVAALGQYLSQINSAPDSNTAAFEAARGRFTGNNPEALQQLKNLATTAPTPVAGWLNKLSDSSWAVLMVKAKSHINNVWRYQVFDTYRNRLGDRYPMNADRQSESSVVAFNEYFKPGGIQQTFVNEYIAPFVDTYRWQEKNYSGVRLGLSDETLAQFRRAENIRRAFFAKGESVAVEFKAEPVKLHSGVRLFTLETGESRISYSHGPRIGKGLMWNGGEDSRARVIFEDLNEKVSADQYSGDWAFIRLLDKARISKTSNSASRNLTFSKDGYEAVFKVTAATNINAFDLGLLRNYRCTEQL